MTFPKASGAVWIWVPTSKACSGVNRIFVTRSGTATKHSCMAMSASLAYSDEPFVGISVRAEDELQPVPFEAEADRSVE